MQQKQIANTSGSAAHASTSKWKIDAVSPLRGGLKILYSSEQRKDSAARYEMVFTQEECARIQEFLKQEETDPLERIAGALEKLVEKT